MMDWCVAMDRIAACSTAIPSAREGTGAGLKTLLGFLDHEDVLVAYSAKEKLRNILLRDNIGVHNVAKIVRALLVRSPTTWRGEGSGFRFQLLRQLVKMKNAGDSGSKDGANDDKETQSVGYWYLQEILENMQQMKTMVRSVFIPTGCMTATAPHSAQYETLVFLSDFMEQLQSLTITKDSQVELCGLMIGLVEDVFVTMNYSSQPTFVSCAVLGLLGNFQELMQSWKHQTRVDGENDLEVVYSKWIEWSLVWLIQSSCMSTALQFFNNKEALSVASQEAFVATSSHNSFLQQWLLYLSRVGVAFMEPLLTQTKKTDWRVLQALGRHGGSWTQQQMPNRRQLFEVLAEQDDVMIEVLNGLTRMAMLVEGADEMLAQRYSSFIAPVITEYDPDLLFADLMDTLGRDHLVLLDLLISNETQMLEYLMRYLRRLGTHWNTSKRKLQSQRLLDVMSVIIRLRLEIDRLVAADLFPYGAGPLTRRLLAIEQLYEELGDEDAEQL